MNSYWFIQPQAMPQNWAWHRWLHRLHILFASLIENRSDDDARTGDVNAQAFVNRLRNGDNDAWDELVTTISPKLFGYIRYNLPTKEDAEDVLNDVFVGAVKSIANYDGRSTVLTWLSAIARFKIADFYRNQNGVTEELNEWLRAPDTETDEYSLDMRKALMAMPTDMRQVILLRYRQGLSVQETAEVIGRTYKATESLLTRSRVALANLLSDVESVQT